MQSYQKTITVQKDDLDDLDHVNNVRYVQWMQDISKEHWVTVAPEEMRNGIIWVVMTHHITYKSAAVLDDVIEMRTYIQKSRGAVSVRIVEMYNKKTKELLVKSSTEWCLLNAETLKPTRISQEIKDVFLKM
ncbi:thioesterase family protein [Zobellia roscoffensis]|uniref:acyl-CoA thioesterase n=1 Tax=Zobellia roscoffensis TaxID=2779508 RepID=UPI00188C64BA|nr:thioesterase family protein [Zobellia roscoffensis]